MTQAQGGARHERAGPAHELGARCSRVDQTPDPSFYVGLLDATRAATLDQARREPETVFAPLDLHADLHVLDVGCGTATICGSWHQWLLPVEPPAWI